MPISIDTPNVNIVRKLIILGANPNIKNEQRYLPRTDDLDCHSDVTALDLAIARGDLSMAQIIIDSDMVSLDTILNSLQILDKCQASNDLDDQDRAYDSKSDSQNSFRNKRCPTSRPGY